MKRPSAYITTSEMAPNKLQKFSEMETIPFVLQYPFSVLKEKGFPLKGRWREDFFHNENPIVLELGCGKGEYTVGLAERYPDKNFIGIDIKGARMWTGAKQALVNDMKNVAFLRTHIEMLEEFFAPGEVDEIWITFPDPQMKKVRKRLTSTRFVEMYRNLLKPGGVIHLKTDSPFLFTYTKILTETNTEALGVVACTDNLYANPDAIGDIIDIKTHYERQWIERGLSIKYIALRLVDTTPLTEPDVEIEHDTYRSYSRGEVQCPQLCNPKVSPRSKQ